MSDCNERLSDCVIFSRFQRVCEALAASGQSHNHAIIYFNRSIVNSFIHSLRRQRPNTVRFAVAAIHGSSI